MKPLFKTKAKCTEEEFIKFNKILLKAHHFRTIIIIIEVLALISYITYKKIFDLLFIILFPIVYYIFIKMLIKREFSSNKTIKNIVSEYTFYNDYFEEKTIYNKTKIEYRMLYKVIETKDNIYLMTGKNTGYVLIKKDMPKGLKDFIKKKLLKEW